MEAKTKKIMLWTSGILLAAGIGAYFYFKRKNETEIEIEVPVNSGGNTSAPQTQASVPGKTGVNQIKKQSAQTTSTPVKVATTKITIVNANDLLAGDINGANSKHLYAINAGVGVYNMDNKKVFDTKKNQYLGVVQSARKSGSGYILNFITADKVKYWVSASGMGLKK